MKYPGVDGESNDGNQEKWIDLDEPQGGCNDGDGINLPNLALAGALLLVLAGFF